MIPKMNKSYKNRVTAIDNIFKTTSLDNGFEIEIIKTDISGHFPIMLVQRKIIASKTIKWKVFLQREKNWTF